jgi:hypothetical protein
MAKEFKLKGISSLDLKLGEKREVEVEGMDGAKVLLVKPADKVAAITPKYDCPPCSMHQFADGRHVAVRITERHLRRE